MNNEEHESKDQRVIRRWRQSKLRSHPPLRATAEEKAWIDEQMKDFKPKPYVCPWDDDIYQDEDETHPWERPGWDRAAALHTGYVPPSAGGEPANPVVGAGESFADMFDKFSANPNDMEAASTDDTPPAKVDPNWAEPTPAEKAKITALVAARWSVADMAKYLEIGQDEFLWAYHDTLRTAELQMRARLTTTLFGDGLSAPGPARNRIADFMGVFKHAPKASPPVPTGQPLRETHARARPAESIGRAGGRNSRRARYGGPLPKADPDGRIRFEMMLGETSIRAKFDVMAQHVARELELLIELRASRGQDRDGNPMDAAG